MSPDKQFRHQAASIEPESEVDDKRLRIVVTMNVYTQGVTELKRNAQHRIVRTVTGGKDEEAEETA